MRYFIDTMEKLNMNIDNIHTETNYLLTFPYVLLSFIVLEVVTYIVRWGLSVDCYIGVHLTSKF